MPPLILRHAIDRHQFAIMRPPPRRSEQVESVPRPIGRHQELLPLRPDALSWEMDVFGHETACDVDGVGMQREIQAADELHRSQHAQGVFCECWTDVTEHTRGEVGQSSVGIDDLLGAKVPHQRVDREVSP